MIHWLIVIIIEKRFIKPKVPSNKKDSKNKKYHWCKKNHTM